MVPMRNSRIPWLRTIPAPWDEVRLRFLFDRIEQGWSPQAELREPAEDEWGVLKLDAVSQGRFNDHAAKALPPDVEPRVDYEVKSGDFLLTRANTPSRVGEVCLVESTRPRLMLSDLIYRLALREVVDGSFLAYYLGVPLGRCQIEADARGTSSSMVKVSQEHIKSWLVPLPPLETQRAIAAFLDAETARIDALIAAKENLLAILAEKRRALVTQAVTRGLDPNVPMRDSGIPWLGEIPAHWEVERSRWLFRVWDERSETGDEELLTVSHLTGVTPRSEKDVNMFEAASTVGHKVCHRGDLVINTMWAWMGAMGVAPCTGIVSPSYHVYRVGERLRPAYVDALVRTSVFAQEVTRFSKGVWSSRLRLYPEGFFEVYLPVPPLEEQDRIVAFIGDEQLRVDTLSSAVKRSLKLAGERREAIIAAAVTGQLRPEDGP